MIRAAAWTLCVLGALLGPARAAPADVFTDAELADWQRQFGGWIEETYRQQVLPSLDRDLSATTLTLTLSRKGGPLNAYTNGREIVVPVQTLRFIDELSGVAATLDTLGCDRVALQVYIAKLQEVWLGRATPPGPLAAFGLDEAIYRDDRIKRAANRDFNGSVVFVLAHELGHVRFGSVGRATGAANVPLEQQADGYAIESLATIHIPPTGVLTFFEAVSLLEGYPADHPLSGSRIRAIVSAMNRQPERFVDPRSDPRRFTPVIRTAAQGLASVVDLIDQPGMRAAMTVLARDTEWRELRDYTKDCHASPIARRTNAPRSDRPPAGGGQSVR